MKIVIILGLVLFGLGGALLLLQTPLGFQSEPEMTQQFSAILWKEPLCDCCGQYTAYLREKGVDLEVVETENLQAVKEERGVPHAMESCHTIAVEGYTVEGHVPMEAIIRLLAERPNTKGIALPGMPPGSPGMGGLQAGPLLVYTFEGDVFGEY